MSKNTLIWLGMELEQRELQSACAYPELEMIFFNRADLMAAEGRGRVLELVAGRAGAVLVKNISQDPEIDDFYRGLQQDNPYLPLVPVGQDLLMAGICGASGEDVARINSYLLYGGPENYANCIRYIAQRLLGYESFGQAEEPRPVALDGIFHPRTEAVFQSLNGYLDWYSTARGPQRRGWVGLLTHRSSWISGNLKVEEELIEKLEQSGLGVIPVFDYGAGTEVDCRDFPGIVSAFFSSCGRLLPSALINLQVFLFSGAGRDGSIFAEASRRFEDLNIPVFRPLVAFSCTADNWRANHNGLGAEIPWSFITPEMQGMIEPLIIGCRDQEGRSQPLPERIVRFVSRVVRWVNLRQKPNQLKKLAIFIHNAPCSGVEATVGLGYGLKVFDSAVRLLTNLKEAGYQVRNLPENGRALQELIMKRKAYSDFRWTSVEEIVASGGCLYRMPLEGRRGYLKFYERLAPAVRAGMERTWGPPPGQGMVDQQDLVITGLDLGNVLLLVQPKRGCFGAKCTGEVCKILQDPQCPPPHQYLATYRYVEELFGADACLHVGTHGSLEFLPGKANALSGECFPDIAIGSMPHLYLYNAGVGVEAVMAKRRSYAAIIGHLPAVHAALDPQTAQLGRWIREYLAAEEQRTGQEGEIKRQIDTMLEKMPELSAIMDKAASYQSGLRELNSLIVRLLARPVLEREHVFGEVPALEEAICYIREELLPDLQTDVWKQLWKNDPLELNEGLTAFINKALAEDKAGRALAAGIAGQLASGQGELFDHLAEEAREIYRRLLLTWAETTNLLNALGGGYLPPGPCGLPGDGGSEALPTGRNLYLSDSGKIPTRAAYDSGCRLADQLLSLYQAEEGNLPEKVAMNLISLDISRAKGEQLSQILSLIGITPIWDRNGKVTGVEPVAPQTLGRPRIDVTVRITGVLRDSYPDVVELLDDAIVLAAGLPEPDSVNFVRKHCRAIAQVLKEQGVEEDLDRRSTIRIFGDPPGTYGAGVDLALKASAWKDDQDLARYFLYFSAHAYGRSLHGEQAVHELSENVRQAVVSYDTICSRRYGILDSDFGAAVQGGFDLVNKACGGSGMKYYHGSTGPARTGVRPLAAVLADDLRDTLFNPLWKRSVQEKGYEGGSEVMRKLQNVFEWQCLTLKLADSDLDRLAEEYVNDPPMQSWLNQNNVHALEEIARRFLELEQRGRWQADPEVLERLQSSYLQIEGDMEESLGAVQGEIQGGSVEIVSDADLQEWKERLKDVDGLFLKEAGKRP